MLYSVKIVAEYSNYINYSAYNCIRNKQKPSGMRTLNEKEMRLLNDPVVKKLQDKIFKMYQTSPTIGKNKDGGYIYPPEVEQYIKNIEREMQEYINCNYCSVCGSQLEDTGTRWKQCSSDDCGEMYFQTTDLNGTQHTILLIN